MNLMVNFSPTSAIIEKVAIYHKNQTYDMDFATFAQSYFTGKDSLELREYSSLRKGLAILPGEERTMLGVGGSAEKVEKFNQILERLQEESFKYEIYYKSIYGDRWKITSLSDIPEEL